MLSSLPSSSLCAHLPQNTLQAADLPNFWGKKEKQLLRTVDLFGIRDVSFKSNSFPEPKPLSLLQTAVKLILKPQPCIHVGSPTHFQTVFIQQ